MVFTGLDIQVFISVAVILGCAFIALLCDYYKGINERLREQALELAVRLEAQARAAAHTAPPPAPAPDLAVILAAISRVGDTIEASMRQSFREERALERLAPQVDLPAPEVAASQAETALLQALEPVLEPAVPAAPLEPVTLAAPVVEQPLAQVLEEPPAPTLAPTTTISWAERPVEPPSIDLLPLELPVLPEPEPEPEPALTAPPAPSVVKIKVLRHQNQDEAPTLIPLAEVAPPPPPPPPPAPEPILTEQIAALAEATAPEPALELELELPLEPLTDMPPAPTGLPKGFIDRDAFTILTAQRQPFTGLVVSIGINEFESLAPAAADKLVADVEKLTGSLISSLTGFEHFACRSANDEFILAFENESGPAAQRRLSNLSERLWDFQLRSLGSYSVVFSWGATEAYGEVFADAVDSASERMRETRMNRRSPASASSRPRLKKVVNA